MGNRRTKNENVHCDRTIKMSFEQSISAPVANMLVSIHLRFENERWIKFFVSDGRHYKRQARSHFTDIVSLAVEAEGGEERLSAQAHIVAFIFIIPALVMEIKSVCNYLTALQTRCSVMPWRADGHQTYQSRRQGITSYARNFHRFARQVRHWMRRHCCAAKSRPKECRSFSWIFNFYRLWLLQIWRRSNEFNALWYIHDAFNGTQASGGQRAMFANDDAAKHANRV